MKAKYQQLLDCGTIVNGESVIGRFKALPMKISADTRLRHVLRHADLVMKDFHGSRNALIEKYGEKQEDGTHIVKDVQTNIGFQTELQELLGYEVDLPGERFTFRDLFTEKALADDQIAISRADLDMLGWLIDEGEFETAEAEQEVPAIAADGEDILELDEPKAASATP